jgi:hypothetical protein
MMTQRGMRPQQFSLRSEWTSAVSGAVLEVQRILSSTQLPSPDAATTHAITAVIRQSTQASAFDLQRFAKARLATVRADGQAQPTDAALAAFDLILRDFVMDNGPTPQVGATPSGSVEIQWLVDGTLVSALFDEAGVCYVLALDRSDEVVLNEEVLTGQFPDSIRDDVSRMLREMSRSVVERPAPWGASAEA